ncbi:T9SS type A sorting domain-containing protein, partial [bacterium BMS3Abin03]|nr:T9SS type A sorting domain-containing protein [bacterium BMS3Abin03]
PVVDQAPRNAELSAGTYNWAISVQQINDTTDEIRWYIEAVHAAGEQASYWFAGIVQDTILTDKLNGVAFWLKDGEATQFNVIDAYIDLGNPIELPPVPWQRFYLPAEFWGFYSRTGGWQMTPPDIDGNVSISRSGAATDWAAVRGGFGQTIEMSNLPEDTALVVTGKMQFVGGGFEGWNGLRFGIFYSDSAGVVDSTADGPMWTGSEAYSSGYLFCSNSGGADNPTWSGPGGTGNVGGVINATWLSTNGANNYILGDQKTDDVAGEGTYDFKLSFKDMGNGQVAVGYSIKSSSYTFEGSMTDDNDPLATTKFNAINFAVSNTNTNTTGLNLSDVLVDVGSPIIIGVDNGNETSSLPTVYSLSQNYPNPFNPTTTIKFGIPKAGDVSLAVYDILGRKVAELINGNLTAGYHTVNFNATNLASGVYFYRIEAGDFVSVKKLMLLK